MIVIGNDLVNLKNPDNIRTMQRSGFEKFFHPDEIKYTESSKTCYACLWAIKEAAYKCILKMGYRVAFSPAKYKIEAQEHDAKLLGTVKYKNETLYLKCIEDGDFVRAVVSNDSQAVSMIKSIHLKNSDNFQMQMVKRISAVTQYDNLTITKNQDNIPILYDNTKDNYLEISLSKEEDLYYVSVLPVWFSKSNITAKTPDYLLV